MNPVKKKEELLNSIFFKKARSFKNDLFAHLKEGQKREAVYSDFLDMLISAQKEDKSFEEIIPDYPAFLASCTENEKCRPKWFRPVVRYRNQLIISAASVAAAALITLVYLLSMGYIGIWTRGFDYVNYSGHYFHSRYAIRDEIEMDFNVRAFWSSGQVLYDDGVNRISVEPRQETIMTGMNDQINYINWTIVLKCTGTKNRVFAQIVCGTDFGTEEAGLLENATFSYELGGLVYTGKVQMRPVSDFLNSTEMYLSISSHDSNFIAGDAENEKLDAMLNAEKITVKISGLIVNQWVRI